MVSLSIQSRDTKEWITDAFIDRQDYPRAPHIIYILFIMMYRTLIY